MSEQSESKFGPPPPELDEVGRYRWKEITGYLEKQGVFGVEYRGPLMILCQAYEDHAAFRANVKKVGSTISSERGTTRNPDCLNVNNAAGTIAKLSAQFGLTPVSQGKMKVQKQTEETNPYEEI